MANRAVQAESAVVMDKGIMDYQVLIDYIASYLGGTIGKDYDVP